MSRSTIWVSLRRIKIHEFQGTLRLIKSTGENWHDIFIRLGELQKAATAQTVRLAGSLLITYFLLQAFGDQQSISVTIGTVTASIPTAYVALASSVTLFFTALSFQSMMMTIQIRATEGSRFRLNRFSANAYGYYHGQDELALAVPTYLSWFWKEKSPRVGTLTWLTMFAVIILFFPLVAMWGFLSLVTIEVFQEVENSVVQRIAAILGIIVLASSFLYVLLFNVPLPVSKNTRGIRFGFLASLYPGVIHPRGLIWVQESNAKSR